MTKMKNSVTRNSEGGCSPLVLNRGKEGQEEKCPSSAGRSEKETKNRGVRRKTRRFSVRKDDRGRGLQKGRKLVTATEGAVYGGEGEVSMIRSKLVHSPCSYCYSGTPTPLPP